MDNLAKLKPRRETDPHSGQRIVSRRVYIFRTYRRGPTAARDAGAQAPGPLF